MLTIKLVLELNNDILHDWREKATCVRGVVTESGRRQDRGQPNIDPPSSFRAVRYINRLNGIFLVDERVVACVSDVTSCLNPRGHSRNQTRRRPHRYAYPPLTMYQPPAT